MKNILFISLFLCLTTTSQASILKGNYELKSSKVNYLVKYLIKKADAQSVESKGKGECKDACEFLIAAPVKSFTSKDSNRDLNMLATTKAEKFPLVVAHIKTKNEITNGVLLADIEIDFAGVKQNYKNVSFKIIESADGFHADGFFDLILDNHKIEKPSLLGVDIENLVPITISADWKKL